MRLFTRLVIAALAALVVCSSALSQEHIPADSLERLQGMFGDVRDRLWEINDEFWHRGEYERCIAMMRLITRIDPYDVDAYDSAAWLMQNAFRDDEAELMLKEGLRNNPDVYDMYFNLGFFYYMHTRFEEAISLFEVAVTFDVPFFVWHQLAHAYELAGLPGQALSVWLQREALDPDFDIPRNQIERILRGEPAPNIPATIQRWRAERKAKEGRE